MLPNINNTLSFIFNLFIYSFCSQYVEQPKFREYNENTILNLPPPFKLSRGGVGTEPPLPLDVDLSMSLGFRATPK